MAPGHLDPVSRWLTCYLRSVREARGWTRAEAVRRAGGAVSEDNAENYELRGAPQAVAGLLTHWHSVGGSPDGLARLAEGDPIEVGRELRSSRQALKLDQLDLARDVPHALSNSAISLHESGRIATAARRFLRYARAIGADLRVVADLLTIPGAPIENDRIDPTRPIRSVLLDLRGPARLGKLRLVFQRAESIVEHPEFRSDPAHGELLALCLSLACGLDERWHAARFFIGRAGNCWNSRVQRAWVAAACGRTKQAAAALSAIESDLRGVDPEAVCFARFQLARITRRATPGRARPLLEAVARDAEQLDLAQAALAEFALVTAELERSRAAVDRVIDRAAELHGRIDPVVESRRVLQLSRAARRVGLARATSLALRAHELSQRIGYRRGELLAALELGAHEGLDAIPTAGVPADLRLRQLAASIYLDPQRRAEVARRAH